MAKIVSSGTAATFGTSNVNWSSAPNITGIEDRIDRFGQSFFGTSIQDVTIRLQKNSSSTGYRR